MEELLVIQLIDHIEKKILFGESTPVDFHHITPPILEDILFHLEAHEENQVLEDQVMEDQAALEAFLELQTQTATLS